MGSRTESFVETEERDGLTGLGLDGESRREVKSVDSPQWMTIAEFRSKPTERIGNPDNGVALPIGFQRGQEPILVLSRDVSLTGTPRDGCPHLDVRDQ